MTALKKQDQWDALNVSHETLDKLQTYADLLIKWQAKINLVSRNTLDDLWTRHFLDSAQIHPHLEPDEQILVDIGCGAGFPGLVLAIMGQRNVHLVDSDARKMAFVREAARVCEVDVSIHNCRIEALDKDLKADVVTSRALASLHQLFEYARPLFKGGTKCFFLKGQRAVEEISDAQTYWNFSFKSYRSLTDQDGQLLVIEGVTQK